MSVEASALEALRARNATANRAQPAAAAVPSRQNRTIRPLLVSRGALRGRGVRPVYGRDWPDFAGPRVEGRH